LGVGTGEVGDEGLREAHGAIGLTGLRAFGSTDQTAHGSRFMIEITGEGVDQIIADGILIVFAVGGTNMLHPSFQLLIAVV
jgi:hypothetical protein